MELVLDFMPRTLSYTQEDLEKLREAVQKILPEISELKISAKNNLPQLTLWIDVKDFDFGITDDYHGDYEIVTPICVEILRFLVDHGVLFSVVDIEIGFDDNEISIEEKSYLSLKDEL